MAFHTEQERHTAPKDNLLVALEIFSEDGK
jgi:hypothetical protein